MTLTDHDRDYYITMLVVFTGMHENMFISLNDKELVREYNERLGEDD